MKAAELRMFNKVNTEHGIATIQLIDTVNVEVYYGEYVDENCKVIKHSDISGIPLTEEWLQWMGFDRWEQGWFAKSFTIKPHDHKKIGCSITINPSNQRTSINSDHGYVHPTHCDYVHQVQNLYHALTGEELTIKRPA